ncbi:hypothetical protein D9M71_396720 [compost metagenome]
MPGDHCGPQPADQQGDHGEDARFGEHRDANGAADGEQAFDHRPLRLVESAEQLARFVRRRASHPTQHAQQHEPHHQAAGPTAAHATQGRQAKVAVDQDVVEWNVEQQSADAQHHARAGAAQAIAEAAQHVVDGNGGEAESDALEVTHARVDQVFVHAHQLQYRAGVDQQQGAAEAHDQGEPERLAHQRADLLQFASAEALGHLGGGGQENAGHQQEHRNPDGVAQGYGGQVAGADAAGHHCIDEAHGGVGKLGDHDGCGQLEQRAQLKAGAAETGLSGVH